MSVLQTPRKLLTSLLILFLSLLIPIAYSQGTISVTVSTDKTQYVQGENVTISGKVLDSQNNPVADASVSIQVGDPPAYSTLVFSDSSGTYVDNRTMLSDSGAPSDWDDLLDPKWRGKIILRSPLASGTMRTIFCAIIQREAQRSGDSSAGFVWLRKLDRNTKTYVADPTQLYLRIAREEAPLSVWDMPDVEFQIHRNNDPFAYRIPTSGTPVLVEGIAIIRGAQHPAAAREFYEFVTSKASILEAARQFYRVPVRSDIPRDSLPDWIRAHPWKPMSVDWRVLARHEQQWMQYWDDHVKGTGASIQTSP